MSEADYGYDCLRLRAAREQMQLTVPEIAAAADLSERAVSFTWPAPAARERRSCHGWPERSASPNP